MITYTRTGNTITDGASTYLIGQRKRVTPSKSQFFLLRIIGKKRSYISSLYGTYPNYEFEYQGKRFRLTLTDTTATIEHKLLSHV
jgi:hypothetical protein